MSNSDYEEEDYRGRRKGRPNGISGRNTVGFSAASPGLTNDIKMEEEIPSIDLATLDYNPIREIQRKQNHNEAEKKRVRNINKCVDDLKEILDKANIPHKSDKVSTLESAVTYMRDLIKERDRLTTNLGYVSNLIADGISGEDEVLSDEDDNHFLQGDVSHTSLTASGIQVDDKEKPCVMYPMNANGEAPTASDLPCDSAEVTDRAMKEISRSVRRNGIDYKGIWMNNSMPCLIVQINSGKLLKGNTFFMKLFKFESMEQLNQFSFFDIISPSDLSLFWSEYSQLVNAQHQMTRAFVCSIKNPTQSVEIPCLLTMGSIMDYDGRVFQVAATFTPLQRVDPVRVQPMMSQETRPNVHISKFMYLILFTYLLMCGIGAFIPIAVSNNTETNRNVERIAQGIRNRGPDSFHVVSPPDSSVTFLGSVLHMQGDEIAKQPLVSPNGDVFLWNGEVYEGITMCPGESDTSAVFRHLQSHISIRDAMSSIKGPWSFIFYRKAENIIYFGRDPIGRRSLLINITETGDSVVLSSCLKRENVSLPPHPHIKFSPIAYSAIYENAINPNVGAVMDVPPDGIFSIHLHDMSLYVDLDPFEIHAPLLNVSTDCTISQRMNAANTLLSLLEQSVERRVSSIVSLSSNNALCVMFSGGIDCSILVAVLCRVLQAKSISCVIELANISFGSRIEEVEKQSFRQLETSFPDRYTALRSFAEIKQLFPQQQFRFVEINVSNDEVMEHEQEIMDFVFPGTTQMDFQIGCCYWFLSRGRGRCMEWNESICFDAKTEETEETEGTKEVECGEKCKTRNCSHCCDPNCVMKMCSVCCCRLQRKTKEFNLRNPSKPRREVICPCHDCEKIIEKPKENGLDCQWSCYELKSKVMFSGIGADELCGGYVRYQTAYTHGGKEASWREMTNDWNRLWFRNLGRDDRCISEFGREMRTPFLDEDVSLYLRSIPIDYVVDYSAPRGEGDKLILRNIASILNLAFCISLSKRAIQFGSRVVKEYNQYMKKNPKVSKGDTTYIPMHNAAESIQDYISIV